MTTPSLVLISGPEQLLADRAWRSTVDLIRQGAPDAETVRVDALSYQPGDLMLHTSPSLFGGLKIVVVHDLDEAGDELVDEVATLAAAGLDDAVLVVLHKGGNRGKRALDALKKAGARVIDAPALKSDRDKASFVTNEFRSGRRKVTGEAVQALLEAVGKDLGELAAACAQLIADTTGLVDIEQVDQYYGGKVDATGFRVAEMAVLGDTAQALRLLRHALASGVDPVPIVAVLAGQLRQIAKVASAGHGSSGAVARDLGMAPWQVDRARRSARGWDGERLGRAIQAVAAADFEVKGGGRDPVYAVERAVLTICRERQGR